MPQCKSERRGCRSVIAGVVSCVGRANVHIDIVERVRSVEAWRGSIVASEMRDRGGGGLLLGVLFFRVF